MLGRAFLVVSVAFLLLLGFAFYQDLSRPWVPIQQKYAAQYGQAVALFTEVALADSFADFLTIPAYERMP